MSRFQYFIYKDCAKYKAEDKTAVYDEIRKGPKTVNEIAKATGIPNKHVSDLCRNIEGYGAIQKVGRGRQGKVIYGVKA